MKPTTLKKHLQYKVPQIRLAVIREQEAAEPLSFNCPEDVARAVEPLKHCSEEYFLVFHLDTRSQIVGYQEVSHGTLNASLVHPREVFKAAIASNCHSIIVAHNHPGGSLTPSAEDLATTKQLIKAGEILGIAVMDHVIVSYRGLTSLRESYPSLWFQN